MALALQALREGAIEIREDGTVWRLKALGKILRHPRRIDLRLNHGYFAIALTVDGFRICVLVHRLIWSTQHGTIPAGIVVNHIDGDKGNNQPANLDGVTRSENARHAYRIGLRAPRLGNKPVIIERGRAVAHMKAYGFSYTTIAGMMGISRATATRGARMAAKIDAARH